MQRANKKGSRAEKDDSLWSPEVFVKVNKSKASSADALDLKICPKAWNYASKVLENTFSVSTLLYRHILTFCRHKIVDISCKTCLHLTMAHRYTTTVPTALHSRGCKVFISSLLYDTSPYKSSEKDWQENMQKICVRQFCQIPSNTAVLLPHSWIMHSMSIFENTQHRLVDKTKNAVSGLTSNQVLLKKRQSSHKNTSTPHSIVIRTLHLHVSGAMTTLIQHHTWNIAKNCTGHCAR